MASARAENILGALALALTDIVLRDTQQQAPEAGPAAAAIALLGHDPGMTIERLRRALGLSHPGAVRLVDRLASDRLIVRRPSERDGRAVALRLTKVGEASCRAILSARQRGLAQALQSLSPAERSTFGALVEKVLRALLEDEDHAYALCRLCNYHVCIDCPVETELRGRA
ncbi:MAG: MarR family winged helix-turn-helix transcriptional regulator [Steroidobacteraceae bacterium]